jgi:hypothetical protein
MRHSLTIALALLALGLWTAPAAAQGSDDGGPDDEGSESELASPSGDGSEEGGSEEGVEDNPLEEAIEEEVNEPDPVFHPSNALLADVSLGVVGVAYEHLIEDAIALHVAAQFYAPWYQTEGDTYGVGGEVRVFWFFAADGYEGAYLSPGFRAGYVFREDDAGSRDGYMLGGRMSVGWGWVFDSFYFRVGIGGQYETVDLSEIEGQTSEDFGSPYLALDLYLGWVG